MIGLELAIAAMAVGGAMALIGGAIDMGEDVRTSLPFDSYAFGGVWLLLLAGVLPAVVALGALRRQPWAELGHVAVGVVLMGWIVVQVAFIGPVSWMQPLVLAWGALIATLGVVERRRARWLARRIDGSLVHLHPHADRVPAPHAGQMSTPHAPAA